MDAYVNPNDLLGPDADQGTYLRVPDWLLETYVSDRRIALNAALTYALIARRGQASGRYYPSHQHIAEYLGASRKQVGAWTQQLVDAGLIEILRNTGSSHQYLFRRVPEMPGAPRPQRDPDQYVDLAVDTYRELFRLPDYAVDAPTRAAVRALVHRVTLHGTDLWPLSVLKPTHDQRPPGLDSYPGMYRRGLYGGADPVHDTIVRLLVGARAYHDPAHPPALISVLQAHVIPYEILSVGCWRGEIDVDYDDDDDGESLHPLDEARDTWTRWRIDPARKSDIAEGTFADLYVQRARDMYDIVPDSKPS